MDSLTLALIFVAFLITAAFKFCLTIVGFWAINSVFGTEIVATVQNVFPVVLFWLMVDSESALGKILEKGAK
ncbi:MAG: hypothetical protein VW443_04835 [Pseudomonadales bacterium]|jgi:hypothetical protein